MLSIHSNSTSKRNPDFKLVRRKRGEDNLKWLARNGPGDDRACLILLGGASAVDFRLRVAQSHARWDLTPSHWSHVVLLDGPGSKLAGANSSAAPIREISLQPPQGFGFPPLTNAVQHAKLGAYKDARLWPNIAIVYVPLDSGEVKRMLNRFEHERASIDAVELVVDWLAFAWGIGRTVNPLLDGKGIPSATMVEYVIGALQYELTPGLDSRSSCPEAIWQAAMWWHEYYTQSGGRKLEGAWDVGHGLVDNELREITGDDVPRRRSTR